MRHLSGCFTIDHEIRGKAIAHSRCLSVNSSSETRPYNAVFSHRSRGFSANSAETFIAFSIEIAAYFPRFQ